MKTQSNMTIKEEILNMIGMNCNFEFKVDSLDFLTDDVYQWHIQQQIKLLEEVKKEIIKYGNRDTNEYEGGKLYVIENVCEDLDSKITNLKEK